ncbi:hypothetical protein L210DRAFT_3652881 [Boletus edulis BED1]|uniref:Uncharacterized protein n=1 Tax=Boletus edulis BED1 TaxID=1328754 RepID=A0AAD4BFR5_BOLED|nr:hypothetical protein L210DRAFT_3652881 [Boletus edulis BED1]
MIWGTRHIISFGSLLALAASVPLPEGHRERDSIYTPWIITPSQETTWNTGTTETVIWSINNAPPDINQCTPRLYIVDPDGLLVVHVAIGFSLPTGSVSIYVPDLYYSGKYRFQLLCGKYGSTSQIFTINKPSESE